MRWWPASPRRSSRDRRIASRLRDEAPPPPLSADMSRGAADMQRRLEDARDRLKRDIAPQPDDEL